MGVIKGVMPDRNPLKEVYLPRCSLGKAFKMKQWITYDPICKVVHEFQSSENVLKGRASLSDLNRAVQYVQTALPFFFNLQTNLLLKELSRVTKTRATPVHGMCLVLLLSSSEVNKLCFSNPWQPL